MAIKCLPCPIPTRALFGTKVYPRKAGGSGTIRFTLAYFTSNPAPGFLPSGRLAYWDSGPVANPDDDPGRPWTTHLRFAFGCFGPGPTAQFYAESYASEADCFARANRQILIVYPDPFGHRLVGVGDCSVYDLKLCNNLQGFRCDNPYPPYYTVSERP